MTMKKLILLLGIAASTLLANTVFAYDFSAVCGTGQTLFYTITSDTEPYTVEVVSENESSPYYNTSPTGDLEIPETVEYNGITYSVTRIGDHAFKSCNGLTSLEIPNSVTTIGEEAFYQCSGIVGSLTLSNSVTTIGRYSFGTCSGLETITIGSAMDSIAGRAFYNCSSLTTVNFNAVNCRKIGDYMGGLYAFAECSAVATLNIDENVTYIGAYAFWGWSGLTTVNYNATNSTVGTNIWRDCTSFTSLNIGENVTEIPANIFSGSNITSVIIPNAVTVIGLSAFSSCSALETVTIGYAVDSMAEQAFYDCDALTTINYNATNCRECGGTTWTAFSNCDAVRNLNIGENVTNIPAYLFKDLYALNTVTIPSSVTSIGDYAFRYVKNINYSGTATGSPWGAITVNGYEEGDLVYSDDTKTQLTGCSIFATSATIQNTVTSIGDYAFYKCAQLTDISIPNTVTEIGNKIFYGCDGLIEPVYNDTYFVYLPTGYASSEYAIPEGIKHIAGSAFYDCDGLTAITIPNTVTSIGEFAFYSCGGLTNVTINDSITSIGDGAFQSCNNLATVNFNATNCTTMSTNSLYSVFNSCSALTTLNIGENVKIIPDYAFKCCRSLTEVTIPDSVTSIGFQAFSLCDALTTVNFNATNCTANGTVFQGSSALSTVNFGENVKNIPEYAFSSCTGLTEITLPDSLVNIDGYAFSGCTGLTSITIPESVTSIGDRAFQNCSGLTTINFNAKNCTTMGNSSVNPVFYNCTSLATVNIGENVTNIPSCAFYDCSSLTSVTFGNSVTNIGSYAFSSCSGLTSITIPDSVTSIGERAFQNCSGLTTINFNAKNCTTMGSSSKRVFDNCTLLATLNIGENVKSIPDYAFYGCTGLTTITIPDSVTNIGEYAFYSCSGLTTVNFNAKNCTTMGSSSKRVFDNCTLLATLNIGDNVKSIPDYAFYGCTGLTSITIPDSVTSIGVRAFYGCSGLESITIGNSLESIADYAFDNCSSLTSVHISDISQWCAISFDGLSTNANPLGLAHNLYIDNELVTDLVLPNTITEIKSYAFKDATCLTSVTIPSSVTSIGSQAFYGCSNLTAVNFNAENCTTMGTLSGSVFFNCTSITTLNIGERVKSIPNYAFTECTGLTEITIPDSVTYIGDRAFLACSGLTTVNFNAENCTSMGTTNYAAFYNGTFTTLNIGENVKNIPDYAFSGCTGLTQLTFPNLVTNIGSYAFSDCSGLTEITIPDSVTSIGDRAFYGCTGLTTVNFNAENCTSMGTTNYAAFYNDRFTTLNISEKVKNIPDYAFSGCTGLTEITIPDSVTIIGEYAFSGCTGLTTVNFNAENCTSTSSGIWYQCSALATLNIGENVKSIPENAFYGCTGLSEITIPDSVVSIGDRAFYGCSGLTTVNFNAQNCTTMGGTNPVFEDCTLLATLNIGDNVVGIPENAFHNCSNLTSAAIGNSVTNIGSYAFFGCSGLTRLIVPDMVTNIGNRAFYNCSGLDSITIGSSVENIGDYAFHYADNITEINALATTPPALGSQVFTSTTAKLEVPCSSTAAYGSASGWSDFDNLQERFGYTLSVSTENDQQGTASITQQPSCSDNSAVITATPATGYRFLQWSDGNTDNPRIVVVTSDITYTAGFKAAYIITASAGNGGTISPSGDVTVDEGESQAFTINAEECYSIASVLVDDVDVTSDLVDGVYTFENVSEGHTIAATFEQITYTITSTAGEGGSITPNGDITVNCGENQAFTIIPTENYRIVWVRVDDIDVTSDLVDGEYTFENVTADHTIEATFEEITYTITATAGNGGSINPDGEVTVWTGSSQAFTILPNEAYRIATVIVDGENNVTAELVENVYTFENVTAGHTIEATFEEIPTQTFTITVQSSNDEYGTVDGGGTYEEGTQVLITATPYEGYRFVSWDDGHVGNPRYITVTGDSTFVANFESDSIFSTITESFEPYELGSYMSEVAAPRWELWTDGVMGGLVSDEQAHYGSQSMKVYKDGSTDTDVVLNVNDLTTGRYRVEFYMYVPVGNTGYYNILQDNDGSDSKWGIQLTFNGSEVTIDANGNQYYHLYDPDSWMRIIHYIDLDNDWADLYMDDELVVAYQWSKGQNGDGTTCKFDAIDFYSQTSNNQSGLFYIDDITISQVSATDAPTNLTATVQNELDVLLSWTAVDNDNLVFYSVSLDGEEIATTTETTYINEHLYPDVYNYQVRAYYGQEIGYSAAANAQATIEGSYERESILVELFAYKSCGYSPYAAKALDDMEASDSLNIIVLDHHITDTFGNSQSSTRFNYWAGKDNMYGQNYGFDGTPSTVFDGYVGMAGATTTGESAMQDAYTTYYNHVKAIKSIYSLTAEFEQTEFNGRTFSLNVTAEKHSEYFGDDQIVVMAALAEDIDYDWSVAGKINNLVRVLYPDANGTEAIFDENNRFSTNITIDVSDEYDMSKCKVVVWIENHTQGRVMHTKRFNVMDFYNITAQQFTITVLANNDAYGTVSGGGTYDEGSEITLIAMPNQGYLFDSWEDGNFDNPRSVAVTSDSTFIADFVKCEITQAIDTVVPNFVTVGEHTFYSTGRYSFEVQHEADCDTIYDINLTVLAEPVYDIGPNPTEKILNINTDGFISYVEFFSPTGQLVMRKEVNGNFAECDVEAFAPGVYIVRIYGEESNLPSVYKIVKE